MSNVKPFVSGRSARKLLDVTANSQRSQADMLLRMASTINDHAEHVQALEDERARLKGLRARLTWLLTGK